jgi:eukaryotic-like serine/threonine-protein kinase
MRSCATPELLERFVHDQMEDAERESVATHLEECVDCQLALERITAAPDTNTSADSLPDPREDDRIARALQRVQMRGPFSPEPDDLGARRALNRERPSFQVPSSKDGAHAIRGFRIVREVGRGGMGVVFEAIDDRLHRRVALKVLPSGIHLDPTRVERFEREAQAAAKLHHTNIVPIFGYGQEDGFHYYAMQFIDGHGLDVILAELRRATARPELGEVITPANKTSASLITDSIMSGRFAQVSITADENAAAVPVEERTSVQPPLAVAPEAIRASTPVIPPTTGDRSKSVAGQGFWRSLARVAIQAALALEYAHRQGVIHRDIKPSNLLLDVRGNVWVADFGLAKTTDDQDLTRTGDIVGTLRYIAPERFRGRCDARSDVYSLGLTLYELVALRPAYCQSDKHELIAKVQAEVPPPLSRLEPRAPRDLVTIIQKSVARDPAARYTSAGALAEDLARFLDGQIIHARRASLLERTYRWTRRNPWAAGFFLLLTYGLTATSWFAIQTAQAEALTRAERDKARDEADNALAIERFLSQDILSKAAATNQAGPNQSPKADFKVREALDSAASKIGDRFRDNPRIEASIRLTIGESYLGLGLVAKAVEHLSGAFELRRRFLGPEHPETLVAEAKLATALSAADRLGEAETHLIHATHGLQSDRGSFIPEYLKAVNNLGEIHFYANKFDQAEQEFTQALDGWTRLPAPDERERLSILNNLAMTYQAKGRYADSAKALEDVVPDMKRIFGPDHPDTLTVINNLAELYVHLDKPKEAESRFREVLELRTRIFGNDSPLTLGTLHDLSTVCDRLGKSDEAEELAKRALEGRRKTLGSEHSMTLLSVNNLAGQYRHRGRLQEAERLLRECHGGLMKKRGADDPDTLLVAGNLAMVLKDLGRLDESKALLEQTDTQMQRRLGREHPDRLRVLSGLASVLTAMGNPAGAEPLLREVLQGRKKSLGADHSLTVEATKDLAECLKLLRKADQTKSITTEAR